MNRPLYEYNNACLFYHHSIDINPDPINFTFQAHELFELYHFVNGSASFFIEGQNYNLNKHDIVLIRPGELHSLKVAPDNLLERQVFHFTEHAALAIDPEKQFLQPFLDRPLGSNNLYTPTMLNSNYVVHCFNNIEQSPHPLDPVILSSLYGVLSEIYLSFSNNRKTTVCEEFDLSQQIIDYINNHLTEDLALEKLAKHFYLSKTQLGRIFKKTAGTNVWEYILYKRLVMARQKIQSGESVVTASQNSGFHDYSAFYRAYKKKYGVCPSCNKNKLNTDYNIRREKYIF